MQERPWHRHYDPEVPPEIEFSERTLVDNLVESARQYPERTAIAFFNARIRYRELEDDVRRLATALAALGVERDSRVAIQLPNIPQTVIAFYAVMFLGAQAVLTNPLYTVPELEHQWRDAGCELAIVTDYAYTQKLAPHRSKLPIRRWIVASIPEYLRFPLNLLARWKLAKRGLYAGVDEASDVQRFRRLVRGSAPRAGAPVATLSDLAVLQYTGGTTGVSKGAMLGHDNLSANVQQIDVWFTTFRPGREVMLTALPLFHVFGLTVAMNWPLAVGATLVLVADPRDVAKIIASIEEHGVTVLPAVPAMFNAINHFPGIEGRDLSSLQACFSGSAPLAKDVLERFEALTGARVLEGFGLTETSPVTHVNPLGGVRKVGSIGIPVPNTDVRIVGEDGADLGTDAAGELLIRGPQVMRGYWNRADETENCLRDGWLSTGDLATVDADGYFRIVGRKKDMIKAGGYNVYPDEVDEALMAHPKIREAATIGVPHERRGETVKSFVVVEPGAELDAEAIDHWCRERLAAYKIPREIEFVDALPRSTVLKVLRRELREREIAKRSSS